jgi:glycine/D-amino acid oxidase-like deaminating enzyme
MKTADVLIIGGGIIGSSIAYNLLNDGFKGKVVVFEKDNSYQFASTSFAAGGVRQQFANPLNIKMVQYSVDFYEQFDHQMEIDGELANAGFKKTGYIYLLDDNNWELYNNNYKTQVKVGANTERLTPEGVQKICKGILNVDGIRAANFGPRDGRLDPWGALQGFAKKARKLGAQYVYDEVVAIQKAHIHNKIEGLKTKSGKQYNAPIVVNAAGPWAQDIGNLIGLALPVEPINHNNYVCAITQKFRPPLPMVVFPNRAWFMGESENTILAGLTKLDQVPGFDWNWDRDHFHESIWPKLADRVPLFETLKLVRGYAGMYENTPDECCILGRHPAVEGFLMAIGFSGHGVMQAPAAGKLISELIRLGRLDTMDVTEFSIKRFASGQSGTISEKAH